MMFKIRKIKPNSGSVWQKPKSLHGDCYMVQCCCDIANFLQNTHNRYPLAGLCGHDMDCLSWVRVGVWPIFSHCCCCAVCNVMLLISDHVTDIVPGYIYLEDWSRWGGSYGNNTRVIFCPAPGRPRRTTNHSGVVAVTPDRPWSTPIITWLNNLVSNIFMTKYVQNHHQIEQRHLLASIVTSRIPPQRWEL